MPAQSGLGFSGIVAIQIPDGGAPGEVLTKVTADNYDYDWQAGGGGASTLQDAYDNAPAPPQITVNAGQPVTIDLPAATNNVFQLRDETNAVLLRVGTTDDSLLELTSVTQGFRIMQMTTAQKNALTNLAGLLVYDTDLSQLQQNDGAGWSTPGAGLTTLQNAYDNSLGANPMITLDGVPTPISIEASVSGSILEIRDVGAANTIFEVDGDPDLIVCRAGVTIDNAFLNAGAANSLTLSDTFTTSAPFIGGGILSNGTVTYGNATWIWALLQESKGYIANAAPGFAAFTLFNAIPFIRNGTNAATVQALILNGGLSHQGTGAVAVTTVGTTVVNSSPNTRALTAFGSMTKTGGDTGLRFSPTFGTVNLSSIAFGTLRAVHCFNPAVALFQPSAGTESMTAYYGMDIEPIPFGGNVTKRGIRSQLVAASNTRFIDGLGTAQSDLRGSLNFPVDLVGIQYGASLDWFEAWAGGGFKIEQQNVGVVEQFRKSFPAAGRMLFDWSNDMELTINCIDGFSLGAQSGANGNQFGNFVTSARTIPVAGDYADFLLTQGGNLTVGGLAMGRVSAWVINGISYANSTGSVSESDTLTVGGMVTSSPGVTITDRQSLHVIAGRSRFDSAVQFETISPATLAAGDNDDWGGLLTGTANNGMRQWARVTGNATQSTITGIDATEAQDGDWFTLTNIGTETVLISHQDAGSSAANRIITTDGNNFILTENASVDIRYDATTARWRIVTPPPAVAPLTGEWQFDNTTTMADPGAGNFRNNNATIGSVTSIAISDETKPGVDASNILAGLASGDQLYLQNKEDASEFLVFNITGTTDNTTWWQIDGTVNASGSNFTDGKEFLITFLFA